MHYEIDVPLEQLIIPFKLKHRYVRYVNIVNVVLFTKNTTLYHVDPPSCSPNMYIDEKVFISD